MAVQFEQIDFGAFVRCKIKTPTAAVTGRTITIKGKPAVQLEIAADGKVRHENIASENVSAALMSYLETLDHMTIFTEGRTYEFTRSKKGKLLSRSAPNDLKKTSGGNDRQKQRILSGAVPALVAVGVMNEKGQVYADKQEKFRQINRFTELVADVLGQEKQLSVVDFGCGKSYLGFAVEHFCRIKGIAVQLLGVDRKPEVIENCRAVAARCGLVGMEFICGDIADCPLTDADMMISLHACDTATDCALLNAVRAGVKYIFSVPCWQHELNANMRDDSLLSRYGIIRERTAALVTDAVRAALLESCGYKVQVLEFVDTDRSLKNLMIRAVYADTPPAARAAAKTQAEALLKQFGASQTFYDGLYPNG